ncbi:MAG: helix-turn-helix domain-containing protein [Actinocatenispora sp.]
MTVAACTDDEPATSRLDYWRHVVCDTLVPLDMTCDSPAGYRGRLVGTELDAAQFVELTAAPLKVSRTERLIRQSDPGLYKIEMHTRGLSLPTQAGRETLLRAGDVAVVDTGRPYEMAAGFPPPTTGTRAAGNRAPQLVTLMVPYRMLPLPVDVVAAVCGVGLTGRTPTSGLVAATLGQIARSVAAGDEPPAIRLAGVVVDLLAIGIASYTHRPTLVEPETRQRALLRQVRAFIAEHLADSDLTPPIIAAAHHISVRYLHRLFQADGEKVADWIRRHRLERCRQDLTDPALGQRPGFAVALRWGFTDAAHFTRLFRATYGLPPAAYRRTRQSRPAGTLARRRRSRPRGGSATQKVAASPRGLQVRRPAP